MNCKLKAGQTAVQRIASVITGTSSEVLELRHALCGNRKICVRTDMLTASLTLHPATPILLKDGTYQTEVQVSGKVLYQPLSGCGTNYAYNANSCNPCNPCKPCAEEDIIFASFKVYSTIELAFTGSDATVMPITFNNCQDFTNEVLIVLPYSMKKA